MKKHSILAVALATASLIAFCLPAKASVISNTTDLGTVSAGSVTLYSNAPANFAFTDYSGDLPADTKITFNYSFTDLASGGELEGNGSYPASGTIGPSTPNGFSLALSPGTSETEGFIGSTPSAPLVLASANLSGTGTGTGTVTIINDSSGLASFTAIFSGAFTGISGGKFSESYSVSSVPLPATLSMFGGVMLALVGFGWMRRKQDSSIAAA